MAFDKIVDSASLDSRLSSLADSIRAKGGTTERLCFETGDFQKAVDAIQIGSFPTIYVTAPADAEITVTDGRSTFTGIGTGEPVVFKLPNLGTWTVKAVRGSAVDQEPVIVSEVKDYPITLIFGIKIPTLPVGSLVKMKVNGAVWEWIIVHQGKPSSMYDESCDGTWLLMKDIYESRQWTSPKHNDYENSDINAYLNGAFLNLLDANIRNVVKKVKIPYRPGAGSDTKVNSGDSGLLTRIFLLSAYELGWTDINSICIPCDGAKLSYFGEGDNPDAEKKRIAKRNGNKSWWWLRSPYCHPGGSNPEAAFQVGYDGDWNVTDTDGQFDLRPALILPSSSVVDKQHNVLN